jgi:uncharacterized membrane protein YeaQ/YmgE (transglycosylase-associated protein family)
MARHLAPGGRQRRAVESINPERKGNTMEFLWFILIGLAAGWLAGQVISGGSFGVIGDILLGVVGALIGGFLFSKLGLSAGGGMLGALIVATIGAVLVLFLGRIVVRHA